MIEMLRVLHMKEKINAQAIKLSGGERRKLSVGIALISGSKVGYAVRSAHSEKCTSYVWDAAV